MKINDDPTIIDELTIDLTFISDADAKKFFTNRYRFDDFVYDDRETEKIVIQSAIDLTRDYYNEIYRVYSLRNSTGYTPLENYNLDEIRTLIKTGSISVVSSAGSTTSAQDYGTSGVVTEQNAPKQTTQQFDYPVNDTTSLSVGKTEQSYESAPKTTTKGTITNSFSQTNPSETTTTFDDPLDRETLNRHGNIGVRSAQELLTQELNLIRNIVSEWLNNGEISSAFMVVM